MLKLFNEKQKRISHGEKIKTQIINTKDLKTPKLGVIGTGSGQLIPRTASGLIYNPETISIKTFQQMEDDAQIKAVLTIIKAPIQSVVG